MHGTQGPAPAATPAALARSPAVARPGVTRLGWIGTGVMGGMISATILAVFFVPVFFVVVMRLFRRKDVLAGEKADAATPAVRAPGGHGVPAE